MKYKVGVERAANGGWCDWITPLSEKHKIACCDCGLVHLFEFRVRKGVIEFRAKRDMRATAQRRRRMK